MPRDPIENLVSHYLVPAFHWMDRNEIWLSLIFAVTIYSVLMSKNESRQFWCRLAFIEVAFFIPFLDVTNAGNILAWLGINELHGLAIQPFPLSFLTLAVLLIVWRGTATFVDSVRFKLTDKTRISRRKNQDIVELSKARPFHLFLYSVAAHLTNPKRIVLGKYSPLSLCYLNKKSLSNEHILIRGGSGYGKTALLQVLLCQFIHNREAIFIFNPKIDDDLLRLCAWRASINDIPFLLIDMERDEPVFALFEGKTWREIEEILLSDPQFGESNDASIYYTNFDRELIYQFARRFDNTVSISENWTLFEVSHELALKKAEKFSSLMRDLVRMPVADAKPGLGLSFVNTVASGGVVYCQCSKKNHRSTRLQRFLIMSISQIARTTKNEQRPFVRIVVDELKYFLIEEILDLFSIGRSDRISATVIHQSRSDTIDNNLGKDTNYVLGAMEDNASIQILFNSKSPETCEYASQQSGDTICDEDTRTFETNLTLSELRSPTRTLREVVRPLLGRNTHMTLRKFEAVVYSSNGARIFRFRPIKIPSDIEIPEPSIFREAITELHTRTAQNTGGPIDVGD